MICCVSTYEARLQPNFAKTCTLNSNLQSKIGSTLIIHSTFWLLFFLELLVWSAIEISTVGLLVTTSVYHAILHKFESYLRPHLFVFKLVKK